jgi:WD40 repeat protein/archaellum biogenesis ATPase FlaH
MYKCDNCQHQFLTEITFAKKYIFISYGHDEHIELAKRLRDDLKVRGHFIWFDEQRLTPGSDWEIYIEEGLEKVAASGKDGLVLLLLTPYSVRRPDGYCLNEIARALARNINIIPLMVVDCEPPLSICRIQWLDMRDCIPVSEREERYKIKFERILNAVEEGKISFDGSQQRLKKYLQPLEFDSEIIYHTKRFTGRKWVFDEIKNWLTNQNSEKLFWITGKPGVGKTAISIMIANNFQEISAIHLCKHNHAQKGNSIEIVKSIAYQLSTQLHEYHIILNTLNLEEIVNNNAVTLFDNLILEPLSKHINKPLRPVVILIDGLDEANKDGKNEVASFIANEFKKTPEWLKIIITSRPDREVMAPLYEYNPYILDAGKKENIEDIETYLENVLVKELHGVKDRISIIDKLVEKSEGVFLYVERVCDDIKKGYLSLHRLDEFPKALSGTYLMFFDRQFNDITKYEEKVLPVLRYIICAFEPFETSLLKRVFSWEEEELKRFERSMGSLFVTTKRGASEIFEPYHKSIVDWLTDEEKSAVYFVSGKTGEKKLTETGLGQYNHDITAIDNYFLKWLPMHLLESGEFTTLEILMTDFEFIMERVKAGFLELVFADYKEINGRGIKELNEKLKLWFAFFRERIHILRRGSEIWPSYKILFQLALEHADESLITKQAESFLSADKVSWLWLFREKRLKVQRINPCIAVIENIIGVISLKNGNLLSWSSDNLIATWDNEGNQIKMLIKHTSRIDGVTELKNGNLLSWSHDNKLMIWDKDGNSLKILEGHIESICKVIELSNGNILSMSCDNTLRLWSKGGDHINVLEGHTNCVNGAIELSNGNLVSWTGDDNTLRLWDKRGYPIDKLELDSKWINGAMELSNGYLLPKSWEKTLKIWDKDGHLVRVLEETDEFVKEVFGIIELKSGNLLSWSRDYTLNIANKEFKTLKVLNGHSAEVGGAIELSNGNILSWSDDKTLRIWDKEGNPIKVLEGHTSWVGRALELRNGNILSSSHRTLRIWDQNGNPIKCFEGHIGDIYGIIEIISGHISSLGEDETLRIWNTEGNTINVLEGFRSPVQGLLQMEEGNLLTWAEERTLKIWDKEGNQIKSLEGHTDWVNHVKELRNGKFLTCALGKDDKIRIWDNKGDLVKTLKRQSDYIGDIIELRNGNFLICYRDRDLEIRDNKGNLVKILKGHTGGASSSKELTNGNLISCSHDKTLRLWDKDGNSLNVLEGHTDWPHEVIELRNENILSCSFDNTLRIWDKDGNSLKVLEGHTDFVRYCIELSNGNLLSWPESKDKTLRIWDKDGKCIEVLKKDEYYLKYPQLQLLLVEKRKSFNKFMFTDDFFKSSGILTVNSSRLPYVLWHTDSRTTSRILYPEGTMIVTTGSGQVCILKLYYGKMRMTLSELEELLKSMGSKQEI